MAVSLNTVIQTYLDDTAFHEGWRSIVDRRDASLATIRPIVDRFIDSASNIETFRKELTQALHTTDNWGATGTGWLMEINKLAKNYGSEGEVGLRRILTGLNTANLGERIEAFRTFAESQKAVLKAKGVAGVVSPGNSAFIVSLFAFWLDRDAAPPIYYISLRRGLKMLLDAGLLSRSIGLRIGDDAIDVSTQADHQHALQAIETIQAARPTIASTPYWQEIFFRWITENPSALRESEAAQGDDIAEVPTSTVIPHEPLAATPEVLLRRLIADLRSYILIDEELVRRIYHALLAGHVILSGPPGTGKTELARVIPELLWQSEVNAGSNPDPMAPPMVTQRTTQTAYATRLVTATDEWSVRTLIGGIAPSSEGGKVNYRVQYGHLTKVILENWVVSEANPSGWDNPQRKSIQAPSYTDGGAVQEFRGRWLVVDEFNRAPIDLALGEALTALDGSAMLRVPVDGGSAELRLPQDFRIIGTLNSFDRNYLNQISEALKRRFAFIEVPPPTRVQRAEERAIVLAKAIASVAHLDPKIVVNADRSVAWPNVVTLSRLASGGFDAIWATPHPPLYEVFDFAWDVFEVIRIYRQLGTAQAIALLRQMLIAGIVRNYITVQEWVSATDLTFCDTIADQLQVLLPDELDVLINALTLNRQQFTDSLNETLKRLLESPRRLAAQINSLNAVVNEQGQPIAQLEENVEQYNEQKLPQVSEAQVTELFHWQNNGHSLPQFVRRLRTFKMERGL